MNQKFAASGEPMPLDFHSVVFRFAKETLLLQSKRRHCINETCKSTTIGRRGMGAERLESRQPGNGTMQPLQFLQAGWKRAKIAVGIEHDSLDLGGRLKSGGTIIWVLWLRFSAMAVSSEQRYLDVRFLVALALSMAAALLPSANVLAQERGLAQETESAKDSGEAAADTGLPAFTPEDFTFFEAKVRPLLAEHCFECHGDAKQKGHLRLDSRESVLGGGESGAALIPLKPEESLLLQSVRYESFEMPPSGKLPDSAVAIFEEWIRRGVPWPGSDGKPVVARSSEKGFSDEDRAWWALRPLKDHAPPITENDPWSRNDIDRFIRHQMISSQLTPAPEADRATLMRRLSFDLIGLPPAPADVVAFENDSDPQAYEKLVDRLLQSPQYGERWARHWLDVVRYADSDGYRIDHYRPDSWRYRDYVIRSLNNDKPYDRFVQEQLAGDELFPDNPDALIATGYLRHWIYEYNNRDVRGQWDLILNEVTDTTSDVFLGVGLQCAKCHDHKYDPLLQKDYFRLRAFFEAIKPDDNRVVTSTAEQQSYEEQLKAWEAATVDIRAQIADLEKPFRAQAKENGIEKFPMDIQQLLRNEDATRSPEDQQLYELAYRQVDYEYDGLDNRIKGDEKEKLLALRRELAKHDGLKPKSLPTALVVTDIATTAPTTKIPKKKTEVGPGFLSILDPADAQIPSPLPHQTTTGRRSALAQWLTQPDNPLSTRVIVNRIWQGHFGRGLAQNASDFGTLGGPPTHPELLDWLTLRFVRNGWTFKDLHRLIVTSATYRQASEHPQLTDYQQQDPLNRDYWRFNTRRLDAEQIRDAILAVSGQLDLTEGGPGAQADVPRRSIYLRVMRNERDSLLDVFDLPLFFSSTASRDTTTSPVQSLLLFNSQIMMNHGAKFAASLVAASSSTAFSHSQSSAAIDELWQRAFCRRPSVDETLAAVEFLKEQQTRIVEERGQMEIASVPIGRLPYRDGQAVIINPDDKPLRMAASLVDSLVSNEFTIEACFQIRSIQETGAVRTIAAQWDGNSTSVGWTFGITGKGSRRKPQTLVMQLFGKSVDGSIMEAALFSDQHIELNTPYFVAVCIKPASSEAGSGSVTFHLKNLANADELLNTVTVPHSIIQGVNNSLPLSLGFRSGAGDTGFDGLIDDVRLSSTALSVEQLLLNSESAGPTTVAFWKFEPVPGLLEDSTGHARRLSLQRSESAPISPEQAALADLCHVLLNSNEFLYVK